MAETCETCRYFTERYMLDRFGMAFIGPKAGVIPLHQCRRFPQAVPANVTGWCGEHAPKQTTDPDK